MACSIFFRMSQGDYDDEPLSKKTACLVVDTMLYPVIAVVCAVVSVVLLILKVLFLLLSFPFKLCSASSALPGERVSLGSHFKCLYGGGLPYLLACLLIVPVIGTAIHGFIISHRTSEDARLSSAIVFMQAPILQLAGMSGLIKP
ncbi:hypothetical protein CpB0248 [Chlamydia pneumoniae TW-183]|uniref:Uncharacterized protein n=3 Tax=Chlamydia pneumoniae TaxID=83558 RepID=Q9Z8U2_CHLPN|nr:hypothetical protein [Chlamydia pneumoniae]AAD18395.1 hypothetical protein CPn_0242 [Chlamydia pneumoniae CWL029]AAF38346.1 hypothetical protein CP_0520 [Chlamydia pneumoniae AR39]AAP98181.1 hypothetical protein CpB0248 [Chlamydia pneumoniae TW-183]CRI32742.1 Uncharacterized protein BN1224_Wien1_A_02490 [Chlamydia pneumoniae]CRI35605.1 Uncharacterized protein BN1224_CM1_A_02520 [Chlamydia pneumoniae]